MSWRGDNDDDDDRHGILLLRLYLVAIFHLAYHRLSYLVTTHNILLDAAFIPKEAKEAQKKTPLFFRVNDDGDDYTE